MDYLKPPKAAFGDSTQKYTNQVTYQPTFELSQNQASEGDSRIEDIKSKLERYKRERDELDKIRSKYHSKSQERSASTMSNQMSSTVMMSRTGGLSGMGQVDKENAGCKLPSAKTQQMMEAQKSAIMN